MNYQEFKQWEEDNKEDLFSEKEYDRKFNESLSRPWWYFLVYIVIAFIFFAGVITLLNKLKLIL